ncbi:MAG: hypothetical protein KI786_07000, partial [Mameliella sp.]|nr:hypothetical protein [Phaeodactylibacter sp.]
PRSLPVLLITKMLQQMRLYLIITIIIVGFSPSLKAQGNRIIVSSGNASGIEDGLQWLTAYSNLSIALEVAEAGDSIWVSQGFYRPTNGADRHATYEIPKGVKIFGGFLGNEATFEERDTFGVLSILSGDIGVFTDSTDNCYHVLTARSPDEHTVLDRFHIRHGNSNGNTFDTRYGGGLFITTEEGGYFGI